MHPWKSSKIEKAIDGSVKLSRNGKIIFSEDEKVKNAEILQTLNIVQNNEFFKSASGDNKRFQGMFLNSKIAESYQQQETKLKYLLQFGIVQINSLCEYILIELPKQNSFRGKNGVGNTDRYKRIKITLMISPCYRTWRLLSL